MDAVYFVKIDLRRLCEVLRPAVPLELTEDDVCDWLVSRGFRIGMKGWYADRKRLDTLMPDVIVSCDRVSAA